MFNYLLVLVVSGSLHFCRWVVQSTCRTLTLCPADFRWPYLVFLSCSFILFYFAFFTPIPYPRKLLRKKWKGEQNPKVEKEQAQDTKYSVSMKNYNFIDLPEERRVWCLGAVPWVGAFRQCS